MKQVKRLAKKVNKLNRYLEKKGLKGTVSIELGYSDNPAITFYGNSKKELLKETDLKFGFRREPYEMYYKEFYGVDCQAMKETETLPDDHEMEKV